MADNYRHFMLVVVGEQPQEIVKKYDNSIKVDPYVVFKFSDAKKYHNKYIKVYTELLKHMDKANPQYPLIEEELENLKNEDDTDFYLEMTDGYDIDEKTGDAISTKNPDGKYDGCTLGKNFALPLINKNGEEVYSCRKGDVDWGKVHLNDADAYKFAWESVMEGRKPETDNEKHIYENMKNRKEYFIHFGTKENYILSNTSFWGYAFLSKNLGWVELDDTTNQYDWVKGFYKRFIEPLDDNELISIYECLRN